MPTALLPLAGSAIGAVGGAISGADAASQQAKSKADALAALQAVNNPTAAQLTAQIKGYGAQQQVNPAMEGTVTQQQSALNNISTNPALMNAQMSALNKLQQYGTGGLQPQDMAALSQIQQGAAGQANAQNASSLQNLQQMGQGGGGQGLAASLSSGQNAANQQMNSGMNLQAQASQRALQALQGAGSLGGQIQQQQFGQQAQVAASQNAINQFNAQNSQQVLGQNTNAANNAQYANVAANNMANNSQITAANQTATNAAGAQQQQFSDAYQKAGGTAAQNNTGFNQGGIQGANAAAPWQGIGQAANTAGTAYAAQQAKQPATENSTVDKDPNSIQQNAGISGP